MITTVLLPYKITLLSNCDRWLGLSWIVLLPYKITLLSNRHHKVTRKPRVLLPYKITLLSNTGTALNLQVESFTTL